MVIYYLTDTSDNGGGPKKYMKRGELERLEIEMGKRKQEDEARQLEEKRKKEEEEKAAQQKTSNV